MTTQADGQLSGRLGEDYVSLYLTDNYVTLRINFVLVFDEFVDKENEDLSEAVKRFKTRASHLKRAGLKVEVDTLSVKDIDAACQIPSL